MNYINGSAQLWQDNYEPPEYVPTEHDNSLIVMTVPLFQGQLDRIVEDLMADSRVSEMTQYGWHVTPEVVAYAFQVWLRTQMEEIVESWSADDLLRKANGGTSLIDEIKDRADKSYPAAA
jgi:hypothetical protein